MSLNIGGNMSGKNHSLEKRVNIFRITVTSIVILGCLLIANISIASAYDFGSGEFSQRKLVTIDNNGNANVLTDYQVKINVDYETEMQLDFYDLRFTDTSDNILDYWIEDYIPGTSAKVWVNIPSIPGSGTTTIYMYYGNAGVGSESDGYATFDFFDDFKDGVIGSPWIEVENKGTITETNGYLETPECGQAGNQYCQDGYAYVYFDISDAIPDWDITKPFRIRVDNWNQEDNTGGEAATTCLWNTFPHHNNPLDAVYFFHIDGNTADTGCYNGVNCGTGLGYYGPLENRWIIEEFRFDGNTMSLWFDEVERESFSWSASEGFIVLGNTRNSEWSIDNNKWDNIFVAKYADPEPIVSFAPTEPTNLITNLIFEDDFSTDKSWTSYPDAEIIRNPAEENVQWHVDRNWVQYMAHPITPFSGDFRLKVDAMITDRENNCWIDIGLTDDMDDVTPSGWEGVALRIRWTGGGTPYSIWYAHVVGKYDDGTGFSSTSGHVTPSENTLTGYVPISPGAWYSYDLAKTGSDWTLAVYDADDNLVGSLSGTLTGSFSPFNYVYFGNGDTHDWPSANGKIDNLELFGSSTELPDLTLSPEEWDFGTINQFSSHPEKNFVLTNVGDADLIIDDLEYPDWMALSGFEQGTISPTESEDFIVTIDHSGLPIGNVFGEIIIHSNDPDGDLHVSIEGEKGFLLPPDSVHDFQAYPNDEKIYLMWDNPSSAHFKGTKIIYRTDGYPSTPSDGNLVCDRENNPSSSDSCYFENVDYSTPYYFTAFSYDHYEQYSIIGATLLLKYIPGIPSYNEVDFEGTDVCGPVASARILGYWDDHGYDRLVDGGDSSSGDNTSLVNNLKQAQLWIDGFGTNFYTARKGVALVCNFPTYGNNYCFDIRHHDSVSWEFLKSEIEAGRPLLYFTKGDPYHGAHFTHVSGYKEIGMLVPEPSYEKRFIDSFGGSLNDKPWEEDYDDKLIIIIPADCTSGLRIFGLSPIDLIVSDPEGLIINNQINEIPGALYIEDDINGDDDPDDSIVIPDRKIGDYAITVIPEPDAESTDTYTLEVSIGDTAIVLAENVQISEIPDQPYLIESTETEINAAPIAEAEIQVELQPEPLIEEPDDNYIIEGNTFEGATIILDATASYDPDGNPLTYDWSGAVTGTGAMLDTYLPIGEYQVILTVSDGALTATDVLDITIRDTILPEVSAEFIPIDVEEDEGLFEISYSATDICDPDPDTTGIILTPQLIDPEVEFHVEEEIKLEYDLEGNVVEVKGPDPEALWQEIQELGGLRVEDGLQVYIEPEEEPEEVEIKYEDGILKIEKYLPTLKVTSQDDSGNIVIATATPVFMPEEEEEEDKIPIKKKNK